MLALLNNREAICPLAVIATGLIISLLSWFCGKERFRDEQDKRHADSRTEDLNDRRDRPVVFGRSSDGRRMVR